MSRRIKLCVNTQTPFVRFKLGYSELLEKYGVREEPIDLADLSEGEDYDYTPGGVTAMVYPLLTRMMELGLVAEPKWVSLGPNAPFEVIAGGIRLYNISLSDRDIPLYTSFKEGIWSEAHGLGRLDVEPEEYEAYVRYNWMCTRLMLRLLQEVDLFFIHDFQQLHTGNLIGPSAPAILRWHIPFRLEGVSDRLRTLIMKSVEGFDAIIVSTRRDLEGLIQAGYRGKAYQIYPYVDPSNWTQLPKDVEVVKDKLGVKEDDQILLVVGRMDRIKSQDLAIRALASLKKELPRLKLILAGDGSFTGSGRGGLAHPKSASWRAELDKLADILKVRDSVVFTGYLRDDDLKRLYQIADAVLVTSRVEGFNLTMMEAWLCKKPVVVSQGAGSSELVHEGVNGYIFNPGDSQSLAEKIRIMLKRPESSVKMGETGFHTAGQCFVDQAVEKLQGVFEEAVQLYETKF